MVHFKAVYLQRHFLYYTRAYKSGLIESEIIVEISQCTINHAVSPPLYFLEHVGGEPENETTCGGSYSVFLYDS